MFLRSFSRARAAVVLLVSGAFVLTPSLAAPAAPEQAAGQRTVTYQGLSFSVPRSWPVHDLARQPRLCARLDRHAVYLGPQGADARCPAGLVGRTEAVQVVPIDFGGTDAARATQPSTLNGRSVLVDPNPAANGAVTVVFPDLQLVAIVTYGASPTVAEKVAASLTVAPGATAAPSRREPLSPTTPPAVPGPRQFQGYGIDACTAPTPSQLAAWFSTTSYRAVGVYIGGISRACAQPQLTPSWVVNEITAGWVLLPIYVGEQAPCTNFNHKFAYSTSVAAQQGAGSADDAVLDAQNLGIGPGAPIYFDLESYPRDGGLCSAAVRSFVQAWTTRLHALGYVSGFYSSASTGIADQVSFVAANNGYVPPDQLWFAHWLNQPCSPAPTTLSDPQYIPDGYWSNHQRHRQWCGGHDEIHGGVLLNVDNDLSDGLVVGRGPTQQRTPGAFGGTGSQRTPPSS